MSYLVVKVIRGRRYLYEQRTWREGTRMRTQSRSLGPLDPPLRRRRGLAARLLDLVEANSLTASERAVLAAERYAERAARDARQGLGEAPTNRAAGGRLEAFGKFDTRDGARAHERSESSEPADEEAVGQQRDNVAEADVEDAPHVDRIAGRDDETPLDARSAEESAPGVETAADAQEGSGADADAAA